MKSIERQQLHGLARPQYSKEATPLDMAPTKYEAILKGTAYDKGRIELASHIE